MFLFKGFGEQIGQCPEGIALLEKITQKWSCQIYCGKGAVEDIQHIFKNTTNGRTFKLKREFDIEKLRSVNVSDPEIQGEWELVREVLGNVLHNAEFYEEKLKKVDSEIEVGILKF